ncbi:MAG: hypothetical protein U9O50_09075 [Acidobacteriota bacterium]|nr:hypothetical protein [Acidobacteriota bacterium]
MKSEERKREIATPLTGFAMTIKRVRSKRIDEGKRIVMVGKW